MHVMILSNAVTYSGYLMELTLDAKAKMIKICQSGNQNQTFSKDHSHTEVVEFIIKGIFTN